MAAPVFDTNILIDWLRQRPQALSEIERYSRHRISRVTWAEVLAGEPVESRDVVRRLIDPFEVIELDSRIALAAADIRQRMRIKLLDSIILASARIDGSILVTRNTKDFPATMPGIRVPYIIGPES